MKAYTDLGQSKRLSEILPVESADMWWLYVTSQGKRIAMMYEEPDPHYLARMEGYGIKDCAIRCWSLAALLDILPKIHGLKPIVDLEECSIQYSGIDIYIIASNLIDACYEMIIKLHENKYIMNESMNFGGALDALKQGKKVARKGWNGVNMFLWLKPSARVKADWCKDPLLKKLANDNGGEIEALGTICMKTADNKILTGWLASQTDMLSEDWIVVE